MFGHKKKMEAAATKLSVTNRLLTVKSASGKTYSQLAEETGLTNVYVAQLLRRQAQLKPDTVPKLREALPALTDELIAAMVSPPWRSYDPNLIQEPTVYRYFSFLYSSLLSCTKLISIWGVLILGWTKQWCISVRV